MNSASDVWLAVLKILEEKLTPTAIATWFDDCRAIDLRDDLLVIGTSTDFKRNVISSRYSEIIKSALSELFSGECDLLVLSEGELDEYQSNMQPEGFNPFDSSQFTFDRFIVGSANRFAQAAAIAVANNPAKAYNPLFIYGDPGLGKTHLLYAIGHSLKANRPDFRIVYVKGDDFTNELIQAIQTNQNAAFREKYRSTDLLLVDDIQFIAGKEMTQEEFFHTFNTLYESGKQIVLTSDRHPEDMMRLDDRLKSRFEWGLTADIQPPDYETRVAIVKNKAEQLGLILPDRISQYIAENIRSNVRQIEGTVKKIAAYRDLLYNSEIDIELVEKITRDIIRGEREYTPELIISKTAACYGVSADDVKSSSRAKATTQARQVAMYLMRKFINMSLVEIGACFGNRDHATVIHAIKKIETLVSTSPEDADIIRDITTNITNKS
ncbi:MAG: chromosomal replication initiator protein DnaA [Clostridiales bacterium]|nr:chromosomal replication initiator protein DnaA [Clostridiales bacterium]